MPDQHLTDAITEYESGNMPDEEILSMFQELVSTGLVWSLQGHYGRTANELLACGAIDYPEE